MKNCINNFLYRKIFKWGDFLEEMDEKYPCPLDKESKLYLQKLIKKGQEIQEDLDQEYLGYPAYDKYLKIMKRNANIQDEIIKSIIDFRNELKIYSTIDKK